MQPAKSLPGLAAGLLLFDLLINLPGLSPSSPVASLLAPSIDLLVVAAAMVGISRADVGARVPLRIVVSVLLAALLGYTAASRFGLDAVSRTLGFGFPAAGYALGAAALMAAAALSYVASGPVLRSLSLPLVRGLFTIAVALTAVLQVVTRQLVLRPSAIPHLVRDITGLFR